MSDPLLPDPRQPPPAATAPAPAPAPEGDLVDALQARLGVNLADRTTALAALTHKSYVNEHRGEPLLDNERLEFLGDAVIDLAVSHRLMERFPEAREGELSKMRAAVVDEQGLAAMARAFDLGALLRLGRGEELTGGRRKASLLADAMEAVVAAIYLEAGLGGVLSLVDRFLGDAFARAAAGTLDRDFKTQLQEVAQSRFKATPRYRVVGESGPDHAKVFLVELDLRGETLSRGSGRSKKDAEQAAARPALEILARRGAAEGNGGGAAPEVAAEAASATPRPEVAPPQGPAAEPPAPVPVEAPASPRKKPAASRTRAPARRRAGTASQARTKARTKAAPKGSSRASAKAATTTRAGRAPRPKR